LSCKNSDIITKSLKSSKSWSKKYPWLTNYYWLPKTSIHTIIHLSDVNPAISTETLDALKGKTKKLKKCAARNTSSLDSQTKKKPKMLLGITCSALNIYINFQYI